MIEMIHSPSTELARAIYDTYRFCLFDPITERDLMNDDKFGGYAFGEMRDLLIPDNLVNASSQLGLMIPRFEVSSKPRR